MKICKELQDEVGNLIGFIANTYPNIYGGNTKFRGELNHFYDSISQYRWDNAVDKEFDRKNCSSDELMSVIKLSNDWLHVLVSLSEMSGGMRFGKTQLTKIIDKIDTFFALEV